MVDSGPTLFVMSTDSEKNPIAPTAFTTSSRTFMSSKRVVVAGRLGAATMASSKAAFVFYCFLVQTAVSVDLTPYIDVHPGKRFKNVSKTSVEKSLGMCNIECVRQEPICNAFNFRKSDGSCQLVRAATSDLVDGEGYEAYTQNICLSKHPEIKGANVTYDKGWDGKYPAPNGATVAFTCKENNQGFTDGSLEHTATCAAKDPDSWCTSTSFEEVHCELPVDPYDEINKYRQKVATDKETGCNDCTAKNPLPTPTYMIQLASSKFSRISLCMLQGVFSRLMNNTEIERKAQKRADECTVALCTNCGALAELGYQTICSPGKGCNINWRDPLAAWYAEIKEMKQENIINVTGNVDKWLRYGQLIGSDTEKVIIQALISLLVTMYGVVCISGDLREIRATEELKSKTWETLDNRPNFYCFNHRGQSLFGLCPPPMPLTKSALEGPS
ncbi:unnamed protein product [Darwinula stevensoni]|uniref:Apple domain-containing protein n=1 Tax=Darwinula stevensoni TaxID=69355 RepID=A0A7R8X2W3_9CRUS|nr:unnamed protein product [Darwinula stevensoni]CAG0884360.1 unnamed protein product [Darwinula stevensoni]